MTDLLAFLTLVVAATGVAAVMRRLRRLSNDVHAFWGRHEETVAVHNRAFDSLSGRLRTTEQTAANTEETTRSVARQLVELNRITVDQAVTLVEVRDVLMKRLPDAGHRPRPARPAGPNGGTP